MRAVLVDNYDSFTYNLYQCVCRWVGDVLVVRNDAMRAEAIAALQPDLVILSPGPKGPSSAGVSLELVARYGGAIPMLGVCLGHQCINEAFGGRTVRARRPIHGMTSRVTTDGRGVFAGLPRELEVMRYHSLVADPQNLGQGLVVSAEAEDGTVMALRHTSQPIEGLQFHPESFLTEHGVDMVRNFIAHHVLREMPLTPSLRTGA